MNWKNGSLRIWIFRALVLAACAIMLVSFIMPWWTSTVDPHTEVNIYGWGVRHNLVELASYIAKDVTPTWQVALAWSYVGISIGLALYSTWIKKWWGQFLLGLIGLGVASYAFVAMNVVIKNRLVFYNMPLEGPGIIASDLAAFTVYNHINNAFYMAYVAGGLMILLALLHNIIAGKQR
jgi:hypothetical protein